MKEIVGTMGAGLLRRLTPRARRALCALCWDAAGDAAADNALRELFVQQDLLQLRIDAAAIRYGRGTHPKHRLTGYHDFFCGRVRPGDRVLDVGCGYGAVAKSLSEAGAAVTAIDIDGENIRLARARFGDAGIVFIEADATRFLLTEPFEVVVLSNVLEHIEDRRSFLKRLLAQVKPVKLLLRVPAETRDWSVPLKRELGLAHFNDPTHVVEYTEESFREEMEEAGLEVREMISRWGEIWAVISPAPPCDAPLKAG